MRNPPNLLIALSMMALVPAVASNSAAAEDAAADPTAAGEAGTAGEGGAAAETSGADESTPRRKRKSPAAAAAEPAAEAPVFGGPAQVDHKFQTGFSIMPGSGYRLIVPYKEGQWCGDQSGITDKRVCANYVPFFLDLQLTFGVVARADAMLDLRFGLQSQHEMPGSHEFALAPGIRFWLDQEVALKFYTTLQFVYEYVNFRGNGQSNSDVGMRNANGLMYDPIRNVGFFIQFAETIGMMRWFRIDLDIGIGAQLRFP